MSGTTALGDLLAVLFFVWVSLGNAILFMIAIVAVVVGLCQGIAADLVGLMPMV